MDNVKIIEASEQNLDSLIAFLSRADIDNMFQLPLSKRKTSISDRVYNHYEHGSWLLLLDLDKVIGCRAVLYDAEEDVAEFSTFAVDPSYAGKGLGSMLYKYSIDFVKERYNPKKIKVDSWTGNAVAEHLAYKFGFKKADEYDDPGKRPDGMKTVVYELEVK